MNGDPRDPRIKIVKDGPYLVSGRVPLVEETIGDENGVATEWLQGKTYPDRDRYSLCRCGKSCTKPFCDGTHADSGFDGTETATRAPYCERADVIDGPMVTLTDARDLCAEARFCVPFGGVWNRVKAARTREERDRVVRQAGMCPAGRYVAWDTETGEVLEPQLEPSIAVVEDPEQGVSGPMWVRGGIPIESADGSQYEVRNRVTLCRCGASSNKPFCDGSHCEIGFSDRD